jgi:hypothetical protein
LFCLLLLFSNTFPSILSPSLTQQNKLEQVKACLSDVQEEKDDTDRRTMEVETTNVAIEQAAAAYVDLLDLVREVNDAEIADQFKELREMSAQQIREYRQELEQYQK